MSQFDRTTKASAGGGTEYLTGTTVRADEANTEINAIRTAVNDTWDRLQKLIGTSAPATLEIASGSVTPVATATHVSIDTESMASSDDLDLIDPTNFSTGDFILVGLANGSRVVRLRHNQVGSGPLLLEGNLATLLNSTQQKILFLYNGTQWQEMARFGDEQLRLAATDSIFGTGWSGGLGFRRSREGGLWITGSVSGTGITTAQSTIATFADNGYRPNNTLVNIPLVSIVDGTYEATSFSLLSTGVLQWDRRPESASGPSTGTISADFNHLIALDNSN